MSTQKAPAASRGQPGQTDPALLEWRIRALRVLLAVIAIVSLPSYASTFYEISLSGRITVPYAIYLVVYTGFVVLALLPRLNQRVKAWAFLALTYANAVASLTQLGLAGSGRLYLIAMPVFAMLIVSVRTGYLAAALSVAIYAAFTALAGTGVLAPWLTVTANPLSLFYWGQAGSALLVFLAALVVTVERFTSLQVKTMASRQQAAHDLERTAEALRVREARFRAIYENAPIGMAIVDWTQDAMWVNPAWQKILGYSEEEFGQMSLADYAPPEDAATDRELYNEMVAGKRDSYQMEKRYIRKDGGVIWGRLTSSIARGAGSKPLFVIGMVEDITEQKQARDALQLAYQTLERRVEDRTHALATLNDIAAVVSRSLNLDEILNAALAKSMALIGMEAGAAYRTDETGQMLTLKANQGLSEDLIRHTSQLSLQQALAGKTMSEEEPVVWDIDAAYPEGELKETLTREKLRSVLGVPLVAKGRLVGALILSSRSPRSFKPEELALLMAVGRQVAVAVENASLYEQAERSAALAERSRLARELHDSVTQSLYSITLYAEAASRSLRDGEMAEGTDYLHELRDTAQEALREMRLLIFELRPLALEKSGLAAALQARLESVEERGGMRACLRVEGSQYADRLPLVIQSELYHVAREALNNVLKHGRAQHVEVRLHYGDSAVRLDICDDGVGFVAAGAGAGEGGGLGLRGMRERAQHIGGQLRVDSAPGQGTRVSIEVPKMYETAATPNPSTV